MQTNNAPVLNSAATAVTSPPSTSTQQASQHTAPTPPLGLDADLLDLMDEFVDALRKTSAKALGCRIEVGVKLHDWRDTLGKDDWLALLRSGRLPFSARTAQALARIGAHSTLADPKFVEKLPQSLTALNQIAALPPAVVEQALNSGTIHPDTSLAEARCMVVEHRAKKRALLKQAPSLPVQ